MREPTMAESEGNDSVPQVRAAQLLRVPAVWIGPALIGAMLVFLIALIYVGSIVDPAPHLHDLPVLVVNEDLGTNAHSGRVDLGEHVAAALEGSPAVSQRLSLQPVTLAQARAQMDTGAAYAAIVIPPGFTSSVLALYGVPAPAARAPSAPAIQLLTNPRTGTLGVSLATGIAQPALSQISREIGQQLLRSRPSSASPGAGVNALLGDPITVAVVPYRPLPPHSALGLSAFYISLLAVMCGFLGATGVNSAVDTSLGYATSEIPARSDRGGTSSCLFASPGGRHCWLSG